jgi:hypothetical protein
MGWLDFDYHFRAKRAAAVSSEIGVKRACIASDGSTGDTANNRTSITNYANLTKIDL